MRPIKKGESPYKSIAEYGDALPYLENRIGSYCSYCEFPLNHVPEVEHVVSKKKNPELRTAWSNLLLGCKYCNTRKKDIVDTTNVENYLWPDVYNTAAAFKYHYGIPAIDKTALDAMDPSGAAYQKAKHLFDLVKLGNMPDRRSMKRNEVYETAKRSYERLKALPIEEMREQIVETALAMGFFSVWMTVFGDEPEMLKRFIAAYPGTESLYYDENGTVKPLLILETTTAD